jgi:hypothetical protein
MINRNYIRRYYRIKPDKELFAEMTIISVNGRSVSTGRTVVGINNISPGGLRFFSDLSFPATRNVILEFKITVPCGDVYIRGFIVYSSQAGNNIKQYGVCFTGLDEGKRLELMHIFRNMSVRTGSYSVILKLKDSGEKA